MTLLAELLSAVRGTLPALTAETDLMWKFDEPSGTLVHNYGALGDSAPYQLTLNASNYVRNIRTQLGVATTIDGCKAYGTATYEPGGSFSIVVVFTPLTYTTVAGYQLMCAKCYLAPDAWSTPFMAMGLGILADKADALITTSGVNHRISTLNSVLPGQPNLLTLSYDKPNGLLYVTLNGGTANTYSAGAGVSIDYGAHGNWTVGMNPIGTDPTKGIMQQVTVENVFRSPSYYVDVYKALIGSSY